MSWCQATTGAVERRQRRVGLTGLRALERDESDLGAVAEVGATADDVGQQLGAETHAEDWGLMPPAAP